MKRKILIILIMLAAACQVQADTVWESGHHEINDGDVYGEIWMLNDCTADMWGGDVFQLGALDSSKFNMFGGTMDNLLVRYDSIVNIHGGSLSNLIIYDENGLVNLFAYDVIYDPTGGYAGRGRLEGKYIIDDLFFGIDLNPVKAIEHINIVPEPMTLLFLALGFIGIRKRN